MKRLLRFTASWCVPCKALSINLESANAGAQLPVEVIDIDAHSDIASEYGVRSVPTLVMLDENTEIKRMSGNKSTTELRAWLES